MNERIRAREVRLIDENGEMMGVMPQGRALDIARDRNLDLVEVSPNAMPPVCKLIRGAEMRHPDIGRKLLDEIAEVLKGTATIERSPMMEGRMMSMIVSRAPGWEPPKKQAAPAAGKHQTTPASVSNTPNSDTTETP